MISTAVFSEVLRDNARRESALADELNHAYVQELRTIGAQVGKRIGSGLEVVLEQLAAQCMHSSSGGTTLKHLFDNLTGYVEEYIRICVVPVNGTTHVKQLDLLGISIGEFWSTYHSTISIGFGLKIHEHLDKDISLACSHVSDGIRAALLEYFQEPEWVLNCIKPTQTSNPEFTITIAAK